MAHFTIVALVKKHNFSTLIYVPNPTDNSSMYGDKRIANILYSTLQKVYLSYNKFNINKMLYFAY